MSADLLIHATAYVIKSDDVYYKTDYIIDNIQLWPRVQTYYDGIYNNRPNNG